MDDGSHEMEMTVVFRWEFDQESEDRLTLHLEDEHGRMWDPADAGVITGFLPAGWPLGCALSFKRPARNAELDEP